MTAGDICTVVWMVITVVLSGSVDKYTGTINERKIYHARLQGTKGAAATPKSLNSASCHKSYYGRITPSNPSVYIMYHLLLTFNSSTFCPHSVFLCFVWI